MKYRSALKDQAELEYPVMEAFQYPREVEVRIRNMGIDQRIGHLQFRGKDEEGEMKFQSHAIVNGHIVLA